MKGLPKDSVSNVYRETRKKIMKALEHGKKQGATVEQAIRYVKNLAFHSVGKIILSASVAVQKNAVEIDRAINDVLKELESGKLKW